jgi:hypothetical protein
MYLEERLTDQQIVGRIGGEATLKRVRSWRRRFDIPTFNRSARHDVPPIEGPLQGLLVGSMLGDGRVARNLHTARYMENHAEDQKGYLEWKRKRWGPWSKNELSPVSWKHEGKTYPGWRFETVSHASLLPWHDLFYPVPGPKRLQERVVDLVGPFAFAIWYLDDGCAQWWPRITFGMDLASRGIAWGIFEKLGFSPRWYLHRDKTGEFIFEGEDQAERFIDFIEPHVPECMRYKLKFGFQGHNYQLRRKLDVETLRALAAEGVPLRKIADQFGESATTVSRYLRKYNIDHPRTMGRPGGT